MNKNITRFSWHFIKIQNLPFAFILAMITVLVYAPFFWDKGFYWDEAPWTWIYFRLGPEALAKTFSTSRPFWGWLYQFSLPLLGPDPWKWQLLVLFMRFAGAWLVYKLVDVLWNKTAPLAEVVSVLFLVYPGLSQNYIALMYSHFYFVLNLFLLSLYLTVLAIKKRSPLLHIPAVLLSVYHLLAMEYFYFIELIRFGLIWIAVGKIEKRANQTIQWSLPYGLTFLAVTIWRIFFFTNQNASYGYETIAAMKQDFWAGLVGLILNIAGAFWESTIHAWILPFEWSDPADIGIFTFLGAIFLTVVLTGFIFITFQQRGKIDQTRDFIALTILGFLTWFLGGGAFWLIGSRTMPQLHFSADRFTLSFMLGVSLMVASMILYLIRNDFARVLVLALLVGFAGGKQFQYNGTYRHDWETQKNLFWQMNWRIPAIEPNTTFISNDLPLTYYSDNSLSGILNWIYSDPGKMETILYYASVRTQDGRALGNGLDEGNDFSQNYLATTYKGSTSNSIAFNFTPPGCFRVLDPDVDPLNRLLTQTLRDAAKLSRTDLILTDSKGYMPDFLQPEVAHGWCTIFEAAELNRQSKDWVEITRLLEKAKQTGLRSSDPLENFVFIEAYAHTQNWEQAISLSQSTYKFSKDYLRSPLCALWDRIDRETAPSLEKTNSMSEVRRILDCAGR